MQWFAVRRNAGLPCEVGLSLTRPPVQTKLEPLSTNSRCAIALSTRLIGRGDPVTQVTSTRQDGVSFGFSDRVVSGPSTSSRTLSMLNDACAPEAISISR
jgi:hypothetical protein